jgi:hypothetical protein
MFRCLFVDNIASRQYPDMYTSHPVVAYQNVFNKQKGVDPSSRVSAKVTKCSPQLCNEISSFLPADFPPYGVQCTDYDYDYGFTCSVCQPGMYLPEGFIKCLLCEAGKFSDQTKQKSCNSCSPGFYQKDKGGAICNQCQAGKYSELPLACFPIAPGFYGDNCTNTSAISGCSSALPCPIGYACAGGAQAKSLCPLGTTTVVPGSYKCSACAPGYFRSDVDHFHCKKCDAGYKCTVGAERQIPCSPGRYSGIGSSICASCPLGKSTSQDNSTNCNICSRGKFQDDTGRVSCKYCPPNTFGTNQGYTAAAQCNKCDVSFAKYTDTNGTTGVINASEGCLCRQGFYVNPVKERAVSTYTIGNPIKDYCLPCPNGAHCGFPNSKLRSIEGKPGFWRASIDSINFYECRVENYCTGGVIYNDASDMCRIGHGGILCEECVEYFSLGEYGICQPCIRGTSALGVPWIFLIICTSYILFAVKIYQERIKKENKEERQEGVDDDVAEAASEVSGIAEAARRIRILVSFIQINSSLDVSLGVTWPKVMLQFFVNMKFINLDFVQLVQPISPCNFKINYIGVCFLHLSVLPLIVICTKMAALVASKKFATNVRHMKIVDTVTIQLINNVVFLLYPSLCTRIFLLFNCRSIDELQYLEADLSIQCWDTNHTTAIVFAIFFIFFYVLGIPFGYVYILYHAKNNLYSSEQLKQRFGMLFLAYEPEYWWWEAVEMVKKMILTGGLLIISRSSPAQILVGFLFSLMYLIFLIRYEPFEDIVDDRLQIVMTIMHCMNVFGGVIFRLSGDKGEISSTDLGLILVGLNIFVVLGACTLIIMAFTKVKCNSCNPILQPKKNAASVQVRHSIVMNPLYNKKHDKGNRRLSISRNIV